MARDSLADPFFAALREKSRQALGAEAYEAAWRAGQTMGISAAFDEVLAWLDEPIPGPDTQYCD